jgi:hypothetical protein
MKRTAQEQSIFLYDSFPSVCVLTFSLAFCSLESRGGCCADLVIVFRMLPSARRPSCITGHPENSAQKLHLAKRIDNDWSDGKDISKTG